MKTIEYRITLTKTNVEIGEDGDVLPISAPQKLYAMATVAEKENGEALPLHDILDKLFNQIYGKMTEVDA